MLQLKRDVQLNLWGVEATVPKGSEVIKIRGDGGGYAIASVTLLKQLSGNNHDPKYRYAWVAEEHVEESDF